MATFEDRKRRREERYAAAIATIKAIGKAKPPDQRKPGDGMGPPMPTKLRHTEIKGDNPDAPGFVYFLYCAGRIKIGYATDVAARMSGIATHAPLPITLLLTITGSLEDERNYHEMFADERVNLEWFTLSYRLRSFLENQFVSGTFELLFEAELDCKDFFKERAAWSIEVFEAPFATTA